MIDEQIKKIEQQAFRAVTGIKTAKLSGSRRVEVKGLDEQTQESLLDAVYVAQKQAKIKAKLRGAIEGSGFLKAYKELFKSELEKVLN
jgi:hypothetical protein